MIKRKIEIAQLSYNKKNTIKNKISYKQNKKFISSDSDRENSSNSLNYTKRNYDKFKVNEKLKNNLQLFEKIKSLNYTNNKFMSNSYTEYKNLDKLIKLKRFKKKYFDNDLKSKKEKLEDNNFIYH